VAARAVNDYQSGCLRVGCDSEQPLAQSSALLLLLLGAA